MHTGASFRVKQRIVRSVAMCNDQIKNIGNSTQNKWQPFRARIGARFHREAMPGLDFGRSLQSRLGAFE